MSASDNRATQLTINLRDPQSVNRLLFSALLAVTGGFWLGAQVQPWPPQSTVFAAAAAALLAGGVLVFAAEYFTRNHWVTFIVKGDNLTVVRGTRHTREDTLKRHEVTGVPITTHISRRRYSDHKTYGLALSTSSGTLIHLTASYMQFKPIATYRQQISAFLQLDTAPADNPNSAFKK
jgi:hypothetical protein